MAEAIREPAGEKDAPDDPWAGITRDLTRGRAWQQRSLLPVHTCPGCIWGLPAFPPEEGGLSQAKTVRRDPTYTAIDWVTG